MALVGCRYIQAENPGAVGFGFEWFDTSTGIVSSRDATNTKWVRRGDFSKPNMGFASKSDVDAILATKAPLYNPNFTGTPTKDGEALITKKDIADMQQAFLDEMDNRIKCAISQGEKDLVVDGEIAVKTGETNVDNSQVTMPTYKNGFLALKSDSIWFHGISVSNLLSTGSMTAGFNTDVTSDDNAVWAMITGPDELSHWRVGTQYIVISVKDIKVR